MELSSWTLPCTDFQAFWSSWPETPLVMAESPRSVVLASTADLPMSGSDGETMRQWDRGHVFTSRRHVQWRRLGDRVRVVAAADGFQNDAWGRPDEVRSLDAVRTASREIVLWGRRRPGEDLWLELRIPNLMSAPDQHPSGHDASVRNAFVRRCLNVVTYSDETNGQVLHHRYTGLTYARTGEDDAVFEPVEPADAS